VPINVGIDLVEVDEVVDSIRTHGARYLNRIYTELERRDCGADPRRLAARFAAKEATMKALGRGAEALSWQSIEVRSDAGGRLSVKLSGEAAELARRRKVTNLAISIDNRRSGAAALVLAHLGKGV
jgi:holo-[acyl-carrier protein] synthase